VKNKIVAHVLIFCVIYLITQSYNEQKVYGNDTASILKTISERNYVSEAENIELVQIKVIDDLKIVGFISENNGCGVICYRMDEKGNYVLMDSTFLYSMTGDFFVNDHLDKKPAGLVVLSDGRQYQSLDVTVNKNKVADILFPANQASMHWIDLSEFGNDLVFDLKYK